MPFLLNIPPAAQGRPAFDYFTRTACGMLGTAPYHAPATNFLATLRPMKDFAKPDSLQPP
jgi:hypothetical protein